MHSHRVVKRYVGSTEIYYYCPDCLATYGGEETWSKKALISAACRADITEKDEVEGAV